MTTFKVETCILFEESAMDMMCLKLTQKRELPRVKKLKPGPVSSITKLISDNTMVSCFPLVC